jgi:hypothetical protein
VIASWSVVQNFVTTVLKYVEKLALNLYNPPNGLL